MRVAFIDDDPNELKILHTYFNDLTDSSTISIDDFSSGEEFLSRFTAGLYDLVILDIFMGDLTGGDIVSRLSFAEVEPKLCASPYFYSPSRGIIVNFYEVFIQKDDTFIMSNGSYLPISRRKAKDVINAYSSFCFQQLRKGGVI